MKIQVNDLVTISGEDWDNTPFKDTNALIRVVGEHYCCIGDRVLDVENIENPRNVVLVDESCCTPAPINVGDIVRIAAKSEVIMLRSIAGPYMPETSFMGSVAQVVHIAADGLRVRNETGVDFTNKGYVRRIYKPEPSNEKNMKPKKEENATNIEEKWAVVSSKGDIVYFGQSEDEAINMANEKAVKRTDVKFHVCCTVDIVYSETIVKRESL